ncbi:MAG: hypothetical protein K2K15_02825, partial [Anaeroplasmataceae bacterium]|nr:hypothetical protein [Anaeroplasmataceae bacterium]
MEKQKNTKVQSYALYTFIDMETEGKCGVSPNTYSKSYPNAIFRHKVSNLLISYAIKHFFDIDIEEEKPMKYLHNGRGYINGIYFSIATCSRVVCVCVSKYPTGISIEFPYSILNELEYVRHNFCDNESEEYQKLKYCEKTYFYILVQKRADIKKHELLFEDHKPIDSTKENYTFHT